MTIQSREPVLLTGAGFTHNFGGFLADQMWARIFNHERVQSRPFLVDLLKDNFDFESAYNEVMDGASYTAEDREAMAQAVKSAYDQLDTAVQNYWGPRISSTAHPSVSWQGFIRLLEHFASNQQSRGYIFTLNQDLFVERWYSQERKLLRTPGMKLLAWNPRQRSLTSDDYLQAQSNPTEVQEDASNLLYYVKLHGSMNWRSSNGQGLMVIGGNKPAQIHREPLLRWYFEIFNQVLSRPNRRLLVIGYGFRDSHINAVIAQAVREHNLKLYVVSPRRPRDFRGALLDDGDEDKKMLWKALAGYWDWELKDVCPEQQSYFAEEIRRAIFQE